MVVEASGIFYRDVISITQSAPNEAILVMPNETVTVSLFCPIRVIGSIGSPQVSLEEDNVTDRKSDDAKIKEKSDNCKTPVKNEGSDANRAPVKASRKKK